MLTCIHYFAAFSCIINMSFYSALSEEEKSTLRAGLITNFNEPINQVSEKMSANCSFFPVVFLLLFQTNFGSLL